MSMYAPPLERKWTWRFPFVKTPRGQLSTALQGAAPALLVCILSFMPLIFKGALTLSHRAQMRSSTTSGRR